MSWSSSHHYPHRLVFQAPAASPSPPVRPVKCHLWPSWDGSHPLHSLFPPLVDGGDGSHREPALLRRATGLGIPAHHAQVWGLLLLPVPRTWWVSFTGLLYLMKDGCISGLLSGICDCISRLWKVVHYMFSQLYLSTISGIVILHQY